MGKLTDIQIRNWIKSGEQIAKTDGDGLTFTLSKSGTASWILRYRFGNKPKEKTLGRYPDISLQDARRLALENRAQVQQGINVAAEKKKFKNQEANIWTVKRLAEDYFEKVTSRLAKSTIKGRQQQLRDYVFPKIGTLPAKDVTPAEIVDITERTSNKSLHVARLVLVVLREIFAHGIARHVLEINPCAQIRANSVIGPRPVSRARIMLSEAELKAMLPALPAIGKENELMVKILLATAARIGELVKAKWTDVDFTQRQWTIPAENSKNGKPFIIPMTNQVTLWFSELKEIAFGSSYVLPIRARKKTTKDAPMEPVTLNAAINKLSLNLEDKCRRFTPHDLRSTARSHLGALGVDLLIAERCLNHSLGGLVAVYDQHDYLAERRKALELWSSFIDSCEIGKKRNKQESEAKYYD
ncbi:site-specific recombinase XerD [Nitrosomonas oligotropha]|uniref:Site-specific recombinase XerD n=1 Tax=Nitrosomonas oligotropha TaxID=42354 RepID=A0A2T5HX78_9PROT|nr:site-specific integrase [Nitrosomonas oligotropha]PTQ76189.1 site-specific recombinase XerD [Nitrosomonas oligotropha]